MPIHPEKRPLKQVLRFVYNFFVSLMGPIANHQKEGCFGHNLQSFSGTCENVEKNSGLLIIVPDELHNSLTKISVNLHEKVV